MCEQKLKNLIDLSQESLSNSDFDFMNSLEKLLPKYAEIMSKVAEDKEFIESNRKNLEVFQDIHSKVLTKAEDIMNRKQELTVKQISAAKGVKAYLNKYPRRISAFGKRKG